MQTIEQKQLMQQKVDELMEATYGGNLLTEFDLKVLNGYKNCHEAVEQMYIKHILGLYKKHVGSEKSTDVNCRNTPV